MQTFTRKHLEGTTGKAVERTERLIRLLPFIETNSCKKDICPSFSLYYAVWSSNLDGCEGKKKLLPLREHPMYSAAKVGFGVQDCLNCTAQVVTGRLPMNRLTQERQMRYEEWRQEGTGTFMVD